MMLGADRFDLQYSSSSIPGSLIYLRLYCLVPSPAVDDFEVVITSRQIPITKYLFFSLLERGKAASEVSGGAIPAYLYAVFLVNRCRHLFSRHGGQFFCNLLRWDR